MGVFTSQTTHIKSRLCKILIHQITKSYDQAHNPGGLYTARRFSWAEVTDQQTHQK